MIVADAAAGLVTPSAVVTLLIGIVLVARRAPTARRGRVTFTWIWHEVAPVPSAPPASDTVPLPAPAVTLPPQVFVTPGVGATVCPAGNVSVSAMFDRAIAPRRE